MKLGEVFAFEIQKAGIYAVAVPIGSLQLEKEEYYNNDSRRTPRIVTNKGCIKLKSPASRFSPDYTKKLDYFDSL